MGEDYIPFDRTVAQEYSLRVEVGNVAAPDGMTRVQVDGLGNIEAEQLRQRAAGDERQQTNNAPDSVKGSMSPGEAKYLFEQVSLAPWGSRFPQRPGLPDEAIVEVHLLRAQRDGASMKLWLRDAEKDAAIAPMLKLLRKHVGELSGGRIFL